MHSHIHLVFVDDVQAAFAQFGSFISADAGFGGFGMEVSEPPIRIDFVKVSISDFHQSAKSILILINYGLGDFEFQILSFENGVWKR